MRLMIDKDGYTPAQIRAAIDWAHADDFWRSNILSAKKLRAQYDTLRLQAQRGRHPTPSRSDQIYMAEMRRLKNQEQPDLKVIGGPQ